MGQQGNGAGTGGQGRKQLAANGQCGGAAATGQKAEVADFHEPAGQDVKQRPSNERHCIQRHRLGLVVVLGVAPPKSHLTVFETE